MNAAHRTNASRASRLLAGVLVSSTLLASAARPCHADGAPAAKPAAAASPPLGAKDHYTRGMAAYALDDWDTAIGEFEAGFRLDPTPEFLYNIAQAHRKAKRPEQALRFFRKYLEMAPDDAKDRNEVGTLIGTLEHAIDEQRRALLAPPNIMASPDNDLQRPQEAFPAPGPHAAALRPAPEPRRPDVVGISLITVGAVVAVAGVALAIVGASFDGQATDPSTHIDLSQRESLEGQSGPVGVSGYVAIGVGVVLAVAGVVKMATRPRSSAISVFPGPAHDPTRAASGFSVAF